MRPSGYGGGYDSGYGGGGYHGPGGYHGGGGYPPRAPPGGGEPGRILWVGNVHPDTSESELHSAFASFGMLESVKVQLNSARKAYCILLLFSICTHQLSQIVANKNCAFVRYYDVETATKAYHGMARAQFHGQTVKIGWGKVRSAHTLVH